MKKIGILVVFIFLIVFSSGCVKRIVTINSQPQGAMVYFHHQEKGLTPTSFEFTVYGTYNLKLKKEGYENLETALRLKPPVYQYIPLDFISENLLPFKFVDKHEFSYGLLPLKKSEEAQGLRESEAYSK